jgi:hypothetical protein
VVGEWQEFLVIPGILMEKFANLQFDKNSLKLKLKIPTFKKTKKAKVSFQNLKKTRKANASR